VPPALLVTRTVEVALGRGCVAAVPRGIRLITTALAAAGCAAWATILGAAATECDDAGIIARPCACILIGRIAAKLASRIGRTIVPTWRPCLTGLSLIN